MFEWLWTPFHLTSNNFGDDVVGLEKHKKTSVKLKEPSPPKKKKRKEKKTQKRKRKTK